MASGRNIKGITIEINGDTTRLQTALKDVGNEIRNTQSQLRDVEKLLKIDPGNTELLAQKYRLVEDAIKETKEKLETLKTAAQQANEALANGDITQGQYDALQREIIETEQNLRSLQETARQTGEAMSEWTQKGEKLQEIGNKVSDVGEKMLPVTGAITGLGAAAVKVASDFDSGMSQVAAVSGAAGDELEALREKALEMGNKTQFSATEAADAMNYMAMAGWDTEQMLGGIEGVMSLAAASGEDLATTSDIVTDALTAFGMSAEDSGHFADILAATASNANTNVSMMGETFKYCAPIAGSFGFSAEDTAEAIGLMGNAGIKASQAGTSLRSIMNAMSGPLEIAGDELGNVTIATSNADGSMRDLSDILADCRGAFSQLSESERASAAESLVGKNAMSGFLALMNAGEADIEKVSGAIANCDGAAGEMADTMNDNLSAQLGILKGQLETLGISFGEMIVPLLRDLVELIQGVVNKLNGMSETQRKVILTVAGILAAVGPVLIIVGKVITAVGTIMTIIPKISAAIGVVKGAVAAFNAVLLANPIVLIIAAIAALVAAFIYLWNNCEEFRNFWINLWENIKTTAIAVWEAVSGFFATAWEAIKTTAETIFGGIRDFLTGLWETITTNASGAWEGLKSAVSGAMEAIRTTVSNIWNNVTSAISGAITNIVSTITGGFNSAVQFIRNLVGQAFSWGYDLIMGIANGIRNAIGAVKNAVGSVASAIRSRLHFSVPDEGPLTDYESWMPDFMAGLAQGIEKSRGIIRDAIGHVSEDMRISPEVSGTAIMTNAPARTGTDNSAITAMLGQYLPYVKDFANMQMVTDTGLLVGALAPGMNEQLGVIAFRGKRQ